MWRTKTMQATLPIFAVFFFASVSYSQLANGPTYKVSGDPTTYTLAPDQDMSHRAVLIPVAGASAPNPKAPEPISYFHLEFVVKTLDSGKVVSSHSYAMDANTDNGHHFSLQGMDYRNQTSFRSDIQRHESGAGNTHTSDQTNIDCSDLTLVGTDSVSMWVTASITSKGPLMDTAYSVTFDPRVTIGKPAIVFSSDGPTPNSKIQMEVTATPIHLNLPTKP